MSFDLKHLPQTFADLVIANPLNAAVIKSYCDQPPLSLYCWLAHPAQAKQKQRA
jgi:hypothetical protein